MSKADGLFQTQLTKTVAQILALKASQAIINATNPKQYPKVVIGDIHRKIKQ